MRRIQLAISMTVAFPFVMLACASATAGLLVVPNVITSGGAVGFPFDASDPAVGGHQSTMRYQQVYAASQFTALGGAREITQIAFRTHTQPFSATISNIQIDLSTTTAAPDGLSSTFAANVGADDTIVHSGALPLSSAGTGAFDIIVNLSQPFTYNPAAGNLLMDVRLFSPAITGFFDGANVTGGEGISFISTLASGVSSPTSDFSSSEALITQFQFVPEPSSLVLAALGVAGLIDMIRHRRRAA